MTDEHTRLSIASHLFQVQLDSNLGTVNSQVSFFFLKQNQGTIYLKY